MSEEAQKPDLSPAAFNMDHPDPDPIVEPTPEPDKPDQEPEPTPEPEPKVEPDKDSTDDTEVSIRELLAQATGYEIEDELTDDVDGLAKGAQIIAERMFNERLEQFLSSNETIKEFVEYVQKGGDPGKYIRAVSPEVNYETFDTTDENHQKQLIKDYLKNQEYTDEEVKDLLKAYEDSGILEKQAKVSQKFLANNQKKEKEALVRQAELERQAKEEKAKQTWQQVETTLEKDNLAGLPIAKKEKDEFKKFIQATDDKGQSMRIQKYNSLSMEEKLLIDYIVYKGVGNLNKLVANMATTQTTNSLKSILGKSRGNGSASGDIKKVTPDKPDLSPEAFKLDN
jgi:hypothetical protein